MLNLIKQALLLFQDWSAYFHQHDESHEEGEDAHHKQEELPAVLTAKHGGKHVYYSCNQTLNTHKL